MKISFWIIPVVIMVVTIITMDRGKNSLGEISPDQKKRMLFFTILGAIVLMVGVVVLLIFH